MQHTCIDFWIASGLKWFLVPGDRNLILVSGTRYQIPRAGTQYRVPGTWYWYLVPDTRYHVPGTRYLVPGTRHLVPGTWCQVPWYLVAGTWYQVQVRGRYLVAVIWNQVSGTRYWVPATWYQQPLQATFRMDILDIHGSSHGYPRYPWISMDIYGCPYHFKVHGYPLIFMNIFDIMSNETLRDNFYNACVCVSVRWCLQIVLMSILIKYAGEKFCATLLKICLTWNWPSSRKCVFYYINGPHKQSFLVDIRFNYRFHVGLQERVFI